MKTILLSVLLLVSFVVSAQSTSFNDEHIAAFVQETKNMTHALTLITKRQNEVCGHEVTVAEIKFLMANSTTYAYVLKALTKGSESNEFINLQDVIKGMQCGGENALLTDW